MLAQDSNCEPGLGGSSPLDRRFHVEPPRIHRRPPCGPLVPRGTGQRVSRGLASDGTALYATPVHTSGFGHVSRGTTPVGRRTPCEPRRSTWNLPGSADGRRANHPPVSRETARWAPNPIVRTALCAPVSYRTAARSRSTRNGRPRQESSWVGGHRARGGTGTSTFHVEPPSGCSVSDPARSPTTLSGWHSARGARCPSEASSAVGVRPPGVPDGPPPGLRPPGGGTARPADPHPAQFRWPTARCSTWNTAVTTLGTTRHHSATLRVRRRRTHRSARLRVDPMVPRGTTRSVLTTSVGALP